MRKILIFGNSGSGKTTLASKIANESNSPHLDMDVLAWTSPGVRKDIDSSIKELHEFIESSEVWVIVRMLRIFNSGGIKSLYCIILPKSWSQDMLKE